MIFDDNEIVYNVDRNMIDEWCKEHIIEYVSLNELDEILNNNENNISKEPSTLMLYIKGSDYVKSVRTLPLVFLSRKNKLIINSDIFQNVLIYNSNTIPEFIEFENCDKLNIIFNDELEKQYDVKVDIIINPFLTHKKDLINNILKEYK